MKVLKELGGGASELDAGAIKRSVSFTSDLSTEKGLYYVVISLKDGLLENEDEDANGNDDLFAGI